MKLIFPSRVDLHQSTWIENFGSSSFAVNPWKEVAHPVLSDMVNSSRKPSSKTILDRHFIGKSLTHLN